MSVPQTVSGITSSVLAAVVSGVTPPVLGIDPLVALTGVVGSAISIMLQKSLTSREITTIALCGTASSIYFTSLVGKWIGASSEAMPAISLLLGVMGIYIFRRFADIANDPQHVFTAIKEGRFWDLLKTAPRPETPPNPPPKP